MEALLFKRIHLKHLLYKNLKRKSFFSRDSSMRNLYVDIQTRPHHAKPLSTLHGKQ